MTQQAVQIKMPEVVTMHEVARWMPQLRSQVHKGAVLLDWSAVKRVDSSAVALLLAARREFGDRVISQAPPATLQALADLYNVGFLFERTGTTAQEQRA